MKRLAAAIIAVAGLVPQAFADVVPPPETSASKSLTLNDLVFAQYGGGWVSVKTNPNGATLNSSLILKDDLTYENGASSSGPGPGLTAIGQGFWFARIAADGAVEIVLTRDKSDPNPTWVVRPVSDGTLIDGDGAWTRGQ